MTHTTGTSPQAHAMIDLAAVSENVAALDEFAAGAEVMAVVKADAYSHGMVPVARAALRGGATRLGVAVIEEALALRAAGITAPVLAWLTAPGSAYTQAIRERISLAAHDPTQLQEIAAAAAAVGIPATIHLKVDTGMGRGGAPTAGWESLFRCAEQAQRDGLVEVEGIFSHFASADAPYSAQTGTQLEAFTWACAQARGAGLRPELHHIANSAGTLAYPESHFDMIRPGLAIYGINPLPRQMRRADLRLRPAMSLHARVTLVKDVPAGTMVSYGATYTTGSPTRLAVVPVGYADGIPRSASNCGSVRVGDRTYPISGRVCMDQFVVDVRDTNIRPGDDVVIFGDPTCGAPTVQDWAEAAGTITHEVLTRIGGRIVKQYCDDGQQH